jgi:hypothetical protein
MLSVVVASPIAPRAFDPWETLRQRADTFAYAAEMLSVVVTCSPAASALENADVMPFKHPV